MFYGEMTTEWLFILLPALLFVLVMLWLGKRKQAPGLLLEPEKIGAGTVALVVGLALLLRLVIAGVMPGYGVDMNCFKAWASMAWEQKLYNLYAWVKETGTFLDYPPGYMYLLTLIGGLQSLFQIDWYGTAGTVLIKLPAILGDLAMALFLYRLAKKRLRPGLALLVLIVAAFLPAFLVNSVMWGQVDVLMSLALAIGIWLLMEDKVEWASLVYAIGLLCKPQMVFFFPVFLTCILKTKSWKRIGLSALAGFGTFLVGLLPFRWPDGNPLWFVELYSGSVGTYPYATMNAYNLLGLLGGGWLENSQSFLGVAYTIWGYIGIGLSLAAGVALTLRCKHRSAPLLGAMITIAGVFMLGLGMHERYLYPLLPLLFMAVLEWKEKGLWWLLTAFGAMSYMNQCQVLMLGMKELYHMPSSDPVYRLLCALNVLLFGYLCVVLWRLGVKRRAEVKTLPLLAQEAGPLSPAMTATLAKASERRPGWLNSHGRESRWAERKAAQKPVWRRWDYLWMGGITLIYAVVALFRLGDMAMPESGWVSAEAGESIVLDLGEGETLPDGRIYILEGLGQGNYWLEKGDSPTGPWTTSEYVSGQATTESAVFCWRVINFYELPGRYLRLTVNKENVTILELAVTEQPPQGESAEGLTTLALSIAGADTLNPDELPKLIDEQELVDTLCSYMGSTYFDEIYHARTGYEHLHGIEPYETTHPPLGKVFMMISIGLFGMCPFAWRLPGALAGIAMLPVIYMFAKYLFKETRWAALATGLLAFDFMHFSQTRIATIDSFPVLFMMMMFLFLYRYYLADTRRRELTSLLWSGISFGLAVASKWIGLYGGVGLALMFFVFLYWKMRNKPRAEASDRRRWWLELTTTGLWCVLCFIVIPVGIYVAAYIPFMQVEGPGHDLAAVWRYQLHMFNYHKGITDTHDFASPWWSWPLIIRPLWFYVCGQQSATMTSTITTMGNPAIWWAGVPAVLMALWNAITERDRRPWIVIAAYAVAYLPWALIPRTIFIYHYFAAVPFMILAIVYCLEHWYDGSVDPLQQRRRGALIWSYLGLCGLLFAVFYPVISGMVVSRGYVSLLHWLPTWVF